MKLTEEPEGTCSSKSEPCSDAMLSVCKPDEDLGMSMTFIDIVQNGPPEPLELFRQSCIGECRCECETIEYQQGNVSVMGGWGAFFWLTLTYLILFYLIS